MWPQFYRTFEEYQYIFIYHVDALVFSDQLARWCEAGWDFIGAPWIPCADTPWVKTAAVGNGGFTLMRIESVLQVIYNRYRAEPASYWSDLLTRNGERLSVVFRALDRVRRRFPSSRIANRLLEDWRVSQAPGAHGRPNDFFWAFEAVRYLPSFKVATVEEALQFAFEAAPRTCFALNKNRMPFGCHAWTRFDRAFWEPHLVDAAGG